MPYVAKDFGKLVGMDGFSETLLKNHFTLYQGTWRIRTSCRTFSGGCSPRGRRPPRSTPN